jgi:hypothetical protein
MQEFSFTPKRHILETLTGFGLTNSPLDTLHILCPDDTHILPYLMCPKAPKKIPNNE